MPSAGKVYIDVALVPPKIVHMRDENRMGHAPACGVKMHTRVPDYSRTSDPTQVTCKRCLKVMP